MPEIPIADRSPLLKSFVRDFYLDYITRLLRREFSVHKSPVVHTLAPWLGFPPDVDVAGREEKRRQLSALGLDGAGYTRRLNEVLAADSHLNECFGSDVLLADHIDRYLGVIHALNLGPGGNKLDAEEQWIEFEGLTYQGPLRRLAYTHLFNFRSDLAPIGLGNARIERLDANEISRLLGGTSHLLSFLHSNSESEYFLVFEERGGIDDLDEWLAEKRAAAVEIVTLLQFYKSGVIHATYTIPQFMPNWVTSIYQRTQRTYLGNIRAQAYKKGLAPYFLDSSEVEVLQKWVEVSKDSHSRSRLRETENGFRQMLFRSAEYYISSLTRGKVPERLVDLAIALESMFTPSSAKTELTFRISQNLALLLGKDPTERAEINNLAKKLYSKRSGLLHGQYDYNKFSRGEFVTDDENEAWTALIRRAIVRLAVLYLRGTDDREDFLTRLAQAALNPTLGEHLRMSSDVNTFLLDFGSHSH